MAQLDTSPTIQRANPLMVPVQEGAPHAGASHSLADAPGATGREKAIAEEEEKAEEEEEEGVEVMVEEENAAGKAAEAAAAVEAEEAGVGAESTHLARRRVVGSEEIAGETGSERDEGERGCEQGERRSDERLGG